MYHHSIFILIIIIALLIITSPTITLAKKKKHNNNKDSNKPTTSPTTSPPTYPPGFCDSNLSNPQCPYSYLGDGVCDSSTCNKSPQCQDVLDCNRVLYPNIDGSPKTFIHPGFRSNMQDTITIQLPPQQQPQLNNNNNCFLQLQPLWLDLADDSLQVKTSAGTTPKPFLPGQKYCSSSTIQILIATDISIEGDGFTFQYSLVCNTTLVQCQSPVATFIIKDTKSQQQQQWNSPIGTRLLTSQYFQNLVADFILIPDNKSCGIEIEFDTVELNNDVLHKPSTLLMYGITASTLTNNIITTTSPGMDVKVGPRYTLAIPVPSSRYNFIRITLNSPSFTSDNNPEYFQFRSRLICATTTSSPLLLLSYSFPPSIYTITTTSTPKTYTDGYKPQYLPNMYQQFTIIPDNQSCVVQIQFKLLAIQVHDSVTMSYLDNFNNNQWSQDIIPIVGGYQYTGKNLKLTFQTDGIFQDAGFSISAWTSCEDEAITSNINYGQTIIPYQFPIPSSTSTKWLPFQDSSGPQKDYPDNLNEQYEFDSGDDNCVLFIQFTKLAIANDDLTIPFITNYDSLFIGPIYMSPSRHVVMTWTTDSTSTAAGFEGLYKRFCPSYGDKSVSSIISIPVAKPQGKSSWKSFSFLHYQDRMKLNWVVRPWNPPVDGDTTDTRACTLDLRFTYVNVADDLLSINVIDDDSEDSNTNNNQDIPIDPDTIDTTSWNAKQYIQINFISNIGWRGKGFTIKYRTVCR
jgi:hypothetical protein